MKYKWLDMLHRNYLAITCDQMDKTLILAELNMCGTSSK